MPEDRFTRAAMYATWIKDDTDGLIHQLRGPASREEAPILASARRNVKAALELIEHRLQIHKETVA